ncbi:MAG: BrnA antitoxin family protein [Desulfobulbaceae bacterium]
MKKRKPDNISQEDWDSVESPALTKSILSSMKPVAEKHPDMPRRVRGPQKEPRKTPVSIRLDESIIKAFRARGKGWQSQVNEILRDWLKKHKAA